MMLVPGEWTGGAGAAEEVSTARVGALDRRPETGHLQSDRTRIGPLQSEVEGGAIPRKPWGFRDLRTCSVVLDLSHRSQVQILPRATNRKRPSRSL